MDGWLRDAEESGKVTRVHAASLSVVNRASHVFGRGLELDDVTRVVGGLFQEDCKRDADKPYLKKRWT